MRAPHKQMELSEMKSDLRCPATIGFRVPKKDGEVLLERADAGGVSVHELARIYTISALREKEDRVDLLDAFKKIHQEVAELRKDILVATAVLLTSAGKVEEDEAKDWVEKNLGRS